MFFRILLTLSLIFTLYSCSKDKALYKPLDKVDPYILYKEGLEAFEKNDYF